MAHILFLGLTTVDIFNFVKSFPGSNEKIPADEQMVFAGGPAANASVACSALGQEAILVTGLGTHPLAELSKSDLRRHGVKLLDRAAGQEQLPVLSTITVDLGNGDRSVTYTRTDDRSISLERTLAELIQDISLVMFDGYYIDNAVQVAREAEIRNIPVVLDGGSWKAGLEKLLPFVTYAICSQDFFPPGCSNIGAVLDYLQGAGVPNVAVTGGARDIHYRAGGRAGRVEVRSTVVEDTLGAGDIMHGAFCTYCLEHDFAESLSLASRVATESCRTRGTRSWIESCSPP